MSADFAHQCGELFAEVVHALGFPRSIGQIYGLLYASPDPLSFSDIVKQLEISKGSASQGLHLLRSLGAIKLVRLTAGLARRDPKRLGEDGLAPTKLQSSKSRTGYSFGLLRLSPLVSSRADSPRRDYYEPELGLRHLVGGIIRERIEPLVGQGRLQMRGLRELAEAAIGPANKEFQLERVKQLETWRRQATLLMPVLKTLLAVPRY